MNGFQELNCSELYQINGGQNYMQDGFSNGYNHGQKARELLDSAISWARKAKKWVKDLVNTPVNREWTSRSGWGPVHP